MVSPVTLSAPIKTCHGCARAQVQPSEACAHARIRQCEPISAWVAVHTPSPAYISESTFGCGTLMQTTTEMSFYPNFMATQPAPFVPGVWNGANPYYPQHPLYPIDAVNAPQQPQPGNAPPPRLLHEIRRAASSANPERTSVWDINDKRLPQVCSYTLLLLCMLR